MSNKEYRVIGKQNCLLGEGPYWDAFAGKMRQVDIDAKQVITIDLASGDYSVKNMPQKTTCMAQLEDGSYLYGMEDGIYGEKGDLICLKEEGTGARFNDGKAGPDGCFYAGTIEMDGHAVLYRLKGGHLERVVENVSISNGIDFSLDGKTVYYCDTATKTIDAFDFPAFENRRHIYRVPEGEGSPDGLCIDAEGRIWFALWGGKAVWCLDPATGEIVDKVETGATYTSCPAFVGQGLNLLAVTSSLRDQSVAEYPEAGCTFLFELGVTGRKPYLCRRAAVLGEAQTTETPVRKVAIVTGAGTGIGKGIAYELAKAGYDVAVHCNGSTEGAEEVCAAIHRDFGRKTAVIKADLSQYSGVQSLFDEFLKQFDRLDLFVNNAGVTKKSFFLETEEWLFDLMVNVDYKGAYFCMQRAAQIMVDRGIRGSMVLISSNNARAHFAEVSVYGSVKAAIQKAAEHMAIELAQYGIRVNTIAPGWTDTGASRLDAKESTYYKVPMQRWTTPEEIGKAVLYLASEEAASITGDTLVIDGGALLVSDKCERYGYYSEEKKV